MDTNTYRQLHQLALDLASSGIKIYQVGGSVRDIVYNRRTSNEEQHVEIRDVDIVLTGAYPSEVNWSAFGMKLVEEPHGKSFTSWTVIGVDGEHIDLALPRRKDGAGGWICHPEVPIEEDLRYRDFTFNAMAIDFATFDLVDPYGGEQDVGGSRLKMTYPDSLKDDPIRILRGLRQVVRLSTTYGVEWGVLIDHRTMASIFANAGNIQTCVMERITNELNKILVEHKAKDILKIMMDLGIMACLPGVYVLTRQDGHPQNQYHNLDVWNHTLEVVDWIQNDNLTLKWTALLHDVAKPATAKLKEDGVNYSFIGHDDVGAEMAEVILTKLKQPTDLIVRVKKLIQEHLSPLAGASPRALRRLVNRLGPELVDDFVNLKVADYYGGKANPEERAKLDDGIKLIYQIRDDETPIYDLKNLAVNGQDLMDAGIPQGPEIGKTLKKLHEFVMDNPSWNNKMTLLELIVPAFVAEGNATP